MDYVDALAGSFQQRLSQIFNLSRLPLNLIEATATPLDAIETNLDGINGFSGTKSKIKHQTTLIRNLSRNKDIERQFELFNSQIVVLMVGAMEAHLYDVVRAIGDHNPEMFHFDEVSGKSKVISFESNLLNEKTSVGEIMRHYFKEKDGGVSFQDIQSIVRFFATRLLCDLEIDDYQDILIFATACRNVTVHNNQIIDRKFMTQIRETSYVDVLIENENGEKRKRFDVDETLNITGADISEIKEALLSFVAEISIRVKESYES